jgi:hypothetical protein
MQHIRIRIFSALLVISGIFIAALSIKNVLHYTSDPHFMTACWLTLGIPLITMCLPIAAGIFMVYAGACLFLLKKWTLTMALFASTGYIVIGMMIAGDARNTSDMIASSALIVICAYYFWYFTRESTKQLFE